MELLERTLQLSVLGEHLQQAIAGHGRVVMIGGEAGVGKTALVTAFRDHPETRAQVLQASCDALSTPGPLGPLHDLAPALGISLRGVDAGGESRESLFRSVLSALSARRPTTVIIAEDAHWADGATLELLRFLARRVEPLRLLIAVTYRDDELGPDHPLRRLLGDLATAPTLFRMQLPLLSEAAVRTMAVDSGRDADALFRLTGGNPFFLTEILAAADDAIPATVGDAIQARVARLPSGARAVLDIVAVLGSQTDYELLTTVAGPVYDEIAACVAGGLLRQDEHLTFRHELVRESVIGTIEPPRRRMLHRRVLAAMSERPDHDHDLAALAHHAEEAGDAAAVLRYARAAADQASALHAHREAAAQYARVLRFGAELEDRERATLLEARSTACYLSAHAEDALAARLAALAIWRQLEDRLREGETLRWLSRLYWNNGQGEQAAAAAEAALSVLETMPPGPQLAMAYSNLSQLRMLAYDHRAAIALGERAIALSECLGHEETLIHALCNVGTARASLDSNRRHGVREIERSLNLAIAGGFVDHAGRAFANLAYQAIKDLRLEEADRRLHASLSYITKHDLEAYHLNLIASRATLQCARGGWDAALADCAEVLRRSVLLPGPRTEALRVRGLILARRGEQRAAATALDAARELALGTNELQQLGPVFLARAEAALLAGDRAIAAQEARQVAVLIRERGYPWIKGELAWLLWQAGECDVPGSDIAQPYRFQFAGDWEAAAAAWDALGCPYQAALATIKVDDANLARGALERLELLGARPAVRIARQRLLDLGVSDLPAIRRGPQRSTRDHPAGLTRREAEVLALLVAGLSRPEIARYLYVTTKTVSHHLSAIYVKLGVKTRLEAISAAARLGITAP
jgi:DNA-binding CsgD family transcriptional regulator